MQRETPRVTDTGRLGAWEVFSIFCMHLTHSQTLQPGVGRAPCWGRLIGPLPWGGSHLPWGSSQGSGRQVGNTQSWAGPWGCSPRGLQQSGNGREGSFCRLGHRRAELQKRGRGAVPRRLCGCVCVWRQRRRAFQEGNGVGKVSYTPNLLSYPLCDCLP